MSFSLHQIHHSYSYRKKLYSMLGLLLPATVGNPYLPQTAEELVIPLLGYDETEPSGYEGAL
jgi:hypothetical protein